MQAASGAEPAPKQTWPAGHVEQPVAFVSDVELEKVPGGQACAGAVGEPLAAAQK